MTDALVRACGGFLDMLGGCAVPAEGLARLADYFELDSRRVAAAAAALEENHDLGYGGVRRLLAACLEELCGALSCCGVRRLVEVSVPAPLPLVMALQRSAASRARFSTAALLAEIFLRGLMLDSRPLDGRSCGVRRCGLNRMRERLLTAPPAGDIAMTLQFGSLCDECVKTGEGFAGKEKCVSCTLPRSGAQREALSAELLRLTARAACERLGVRLGEADIEHGLALYGRLMRVQARLALLNARAKRRPLCGNSFALAQTVQLCCFDDWEAPLSALETLAGELEGAPAAGEGRVRVYCFYTPFLRPGIDARFRANGVDLLGNAAFLSAPPGAGEDIYGLSAHVLLHSASALGLEDEARLTARAARGCGCSAYLTGAFSFDRRMGSAVPLLRRILRERYGLGSYALESDFWAETGSPMIPLERIDAICALLRAEG